MMRMPGVAAFIGFATSMACVVYYVYWFVNKGVFVGDLGDARFNMFVLEHVYRWLSGLEDSLLSPRIFFPYPHTLGFSDTHAGTALVYAFFRFAGMDTYHAFNAWIGLGYLGTFLVAYYVLLRLSLSPLIAAMAAFAFAFSLPSIAQTSHAQLTYRFGTPLAFLFAYEFTRSKSPDDLLRLVAACSLQLLMNVYNGLYTVMICGVFLPLSAIYLGWTGEGGYRRLWQDVRSALMRPANYRASTIAVASVITAAALVVLSFHAYVSYLYGLGRHWGDIVPMVPRLSSYLLMDSLPYWAPVSGAIGVLDYRNEHQLFLGVPLIALFVAVLVYLAWRWRTVSFQLKIFAVSALVTVILMTSFGGHPLYIFVAQLPGFSALRAASRYELILVFPLVAAVGLFIQILLDRPRTKIFGAVAIAGWATWSAVDLAMVRMDTTSIATAKSRIEDAIAETRNKRIDPTAVMAYGADYKGHPAVVQVDAMLLAQQLDIPTFNGYSGNFPPGYSYEPSCIGFVRMLAYYDLWAIRHDWPRLSALVYEPIRVRTNTCDLDSAAINGGPMSVGAPLTKESAALVRLEPLIISAKPDHYEIRLRIKNGSQQTAHSLSAKPLRLSWRAANPDEGYAKGWKNRIEIDGDIAPGGALEQTISIPRNAVQPGKVIQITFVVEHQFWGHDIGVTPVEISLPD